MGPVPRSVSRRRRMLVRIWPRFSKVKIAAGWWVLPSAGQSARCDKGRTGQKSMPSDCAVNCRFPFPFCPGPAVSLQRPNRRKGSVKRDAFNPADASAITDESRLALPRARLPKTGRVYPCRSLGCSKREPSSPADASAASNGTRLGQPSRRLSQMRAV